MRVIVCFFLFSFGMTSFCAHSAEEGTEQKDDNAYLAGYLVNWNETADQFSNCRDQFDSGADKHFLLGGCPSSRTIGAYYVSTALIHYTAAQLLPDKYSKALKDSSLNFQFSLYKESSSLGLTYNY